MKEILKCELTHIQININMSLYITCTIKTHNLLLKNL